jgi:hypothetical protein
VKKTKNFQEENDSFAIRDLAFVNTTLFIVDNVGRLWSIELKVVDDKSMIEWQSCENASSSSSTTTTTTTTTTTSTTTTTIKAKNIECDQKVTSIETISINDQQQLLIGHQNGSLSLLNSQKTTTTTTTTTITTAKIDCSRLANDNDELSANEPLLNVAKLYGKQIYHNEHQHLQKKSKKQQQNKNDDDNDDE